MRLPGVGVVKAGSWIHGIHDTFCSCKCLKLSMIKDLLNYFGELKKNVDPVHSLSSPTHEILINWSGIGLQINF